MNCLQFPLTWAVLLFAIQPCHDVKGSYNSTDTLSDIQANGKFHYETNSAPPEMVVESSASRLRSFQPIRIRPIFSLASHLSESEKLYLENVLKKSIKKIQALLSVKRVQGNLLLTRKACPGIFRKGINKGKCAQIDKGYTGEYCLDMFKIPDDHLEGFSIYTMNSSEPSRVFYEDGPGLDNTDFVIYVTSRTTDFCSPYKSSALAYASFCQLDKTNQPVAGQINFCPRNIKSQKFDEDLLYMTSVHELFHALGFSSKLFNKFVKCYKDNCESWPEPMLIPRNGVVRLVTDAVVREMGNHFNCTDDPHFGGPLELVGDKVTSHWHPSLMYSSIMGSTEQKPYATVIDPISLAVLEDSGWYQVNYTAADSFLWGKGQGCDFGLKQLCGVQSGFCSQNTTGCHHLRLSKARCAVETNVSDCGIFAADQRPCFVEHANNVVTPDETISASSRCFMSTISAFPDSQEEKDSLISRPIPKCYDTRCSENKVYVRLAGSGWTVCPFGVQIEVKPYKGRVECPTYDEICSHSNADLMTVFTTEKTTEANDVSNLEPDPSIGYTDKVFTEQMTASVVEDSGVTLDIMSFNLVILCSFLVYFVQ